MTITKTIGTGGDYSDLGAAYNALVALGVLSDDYNWDIISDVTNNTSCSGTLQLDGHTLSISSSVGGSVDCVNGILFNIYKDYLTGSPYTQWKGTISISGLIFSGDISGYLVGFSSGHMYEQQNGQIINIYNCKFKNSLGIGLSISATGWVNVNLYNLIFAGSPASYPLYFALSSHYIGLDPSTSVRSKILENISINSTGTGVIFVHDYDGFATLKNVVSFGSTGGFTCFGFPAASTLFFDVSNCADSDSSLTFGTDNITGITVDDFVQVDNPYRSDYFDITVDGSDLYGVGTTSISNTTDINGLPRPNQFGLVSIGAHEPDNRFDFATDPRETKVTKPVDFYFQGITTSNYSYSWSLGDSLTSTDENPTQAYTIPGQKSISLTVNDGDGHSGTVSKSNYINILGVDIPTKDKTVYPFRMKIGSVNHHLLTEKGNTFYEDYGVVVEGWPYVNIGKSDDINWVRVKFIVPANEKIKYYLWDFGDGATLKTINREVSHKYNLKTRADWMTSTGVIPVDGFNGTISGRWTYVQLTAVSLDNRVADSVSRYPVCIYEIIPQSESEIYFEDGEIIIPEGEVILS
jgi:hypothetical protein